MRSHLGEFPWEGYRGSCKGTTSNHTRRCAVRFHESDSKGLGAAGSQRELEFDIYSIQNADSSSR
jgi:hypothetical protein